MATKKEIMKYVNLHWSYSVVPEDDYYIVYVNELPGVATDGETFQEALNNIKDAIYCAIEAMLDLGEKVPVPVDKSKFKGKIPYRTSSEIHYSLAMYASQKHVSVNKLINGFVKEGLQNKGVRI